MERKIEATRQGEEGNIISFKSWSVFLLTESIIAQCSIKGLFYDDLKASKLVPESIALNEASFFIQGSMRGNSGAQEDNRIHKSLQGQAVQRMQSKSGFIKDQDILGELNVKVKQADDQLIFSCTCGNKQLKLCEHQAQVILTILRREDFKIFFDERLRDKKLRAYSIDYGLENESDLDRFFMLDYKNQLVIGPKEISLLKITPESLGSLAALLLPNREKQTASTDKFNALSHCLVIRKHKYYKHLVLELYDSQTTLDGKVKNPLNPVNPQELILETDDIDRIKFLSAVVKFQNTIEIGLTQASINSLQAVVKNPFELPVYCHNGSISENIVATSLVQVKLKMLKSEPVLHIEKKEPFFEFSGNIEIEKSTEKLNDLNVQYSFFILREDTLYLIKELRTLELIKFLANKPGPVLIHASKYSEFKTLLLEKLEKNAQINYSYIRPATVNQLEKYGFNAETQKFIYLTEFGNYVELIPVIKYGNVEVPIRTKKQIIGIDERGKEFIVQRNLEAEDRFMSLMIQQHPFFAEQLEGDLIEFYLHKQRLLDEDWFLNAFEGWQNQGITILGFNEISGNKINPNKAKVRVQVKSGINWFNTSIEVRFGKKKASLKYIYKAIRNKSRFVLLDDGTKGILPSEWIEKFNSFFRAGDVFDEVLRTAKINYQSLTELYDQEMLDSGLKDEINKIQLKLADFDSILPIEVPKDLKTTLRNYQKHGLNWLNILDDFNFGGCLADDMGLGKTIQIIAFILSQRKKVKQNTNLLVVPTTLLFNWKAEVERFAPSIKILCVHGTDRRKSIGEFNQFEIILTTYGTLLSDFTYLKEYTFNYIFLDEAQNIKNASSQRYKAACLLRAKNRIAITGTPIENNTQDLYGVLSFACPGLLGSIRHFRDIYSTPIDKFKLRKRALELHEKVKPFILRRTKKEVATELPDKTEMVLYCEMEEEQRKVYGAYEKEFREFISASTSEDLPKSAIHVLKGLTKLRQICNSAVLLKDGKHTHTGSAKINLLMEQIEDRSGQHKILVFSQFVSMLDLIKIELEKRKIAYSSLTGSTRNRNEVVNNFQNNPEISIFLISLKAGGTGLNLTAADYVYLVDPWWNPAVEAQAIDRIYRIGQKNNVIAVRLICKNTIEENILILQESKREVADQLIGANIPLIQAFNKQALLELVGS